jgi:hypothetical protein
MAAPCVAGTITFGAVDNSGGTCTLTYYTTGAGSVPPVAMGLLVEVTSGNPIKDVTDLDEFWEIFPDYAFEVIDPCTGTGYNYGDGHCVADPCGAGTLTLPQSKFVISIGGLGGETKPKTKFPKGGTKKDPAILCVLHSDSALTGGTTTGTVTICPLRGGVIDEDAEVMDPNNESSPGDLALPFTITEDCMPFNATTADPVGAASGDSPEARSSTTYANWLAAGKPTCWCYQGQCRGNADGLTAGNSKTGYYHVGAGDLNIIMGAWDLTTTPQQWVTEPTFGPGVATNDCGGNIDMTP